MTLPDSLGGKWVKDEDMRPETNIWGRKYWYPAAAVGFGHEGKFLGYWPTYDGHKPQGLYWFFTPEQCQQSQEKQ